MAVAPPPAAARFDRECPRGCRATLSRPDLQTPAKAGAAFPASGPGHDRVIDRLDKPLLHGRGRTAVEPTIGSRREVAVAGVELPLPGDPRHRSPPVGRVA